MSSAWITSWMGGEAGEGEHMIPGKSPEVAAALLAAAEDLQLHAGVVRTVSTGFIVPSDVYNHARTTYLAREGLDL